MIYLDFNYFYKLLPCFIIRIYSRVLTLETNTKNTQQKAYNPAIITSYGTKIPTVIDTKNINGLSEKFVFYIGTLNVY